MCCQLSGESLFKYSKAIFYLLSLVHVLFLHLVQVSSHLGEQFLLQAETSNLMNEWYSTIQTAIDQAVSVG